MTFTNCAVVSHDDLVELAIDLGEKFMYDCTWDNDSYPIFVCQNTVYLPEDLIPTTSAERRLLSYMVNSGQTDFSGKTVRLDRGIDLVHCQWVPIGGNQATLTSGKVFKGTFDGGGHKISRLYINSRGCGNQHTAFFGKVESATLKNYGIESGIVCTPPNVTGSLVALGNAVTIDSCYNKVTVRNLTGAVGGIIGQRIGTVTISNTFNVIPVSGGPASIGGIIGFGTADTTKLRLENCYTASEFYITAPSGCGGFIGFLNYKATNSKFITNQRFDKL